MIADEFEVAGPTGFVFGAPRVTPAPDGGFLALWGRRDVGPGGLPSITTVWARRYDATTFDDVGEFQVDPPEDDGSYAYTSDPSGSFTPDGGFTVVWTELGSIDGSRYASDLSPLGDVFTISTPGIADGANLSPRIIHDPDGEALATWSSFGSVADDDDRSSIQGRRLSATGERQGGQFQINTTTADSQLAPVPIFTTENQALVTWSSGAFTDLPPLSIRGQLYDLPSIEIFADGFESGGTDAWAETVP